ncbi:MAG TPA: Fur family transcriptional regulator [Tenuifilaceae bacterium]|nr:Fur family transcriptional regulator [Tenuifilaceae bacterium]HPE19593.1 Fur family transcriptional regulator [Tenuifilaceae bacterium]HPJ46710.1 Fur family transcriptional regulator [Tenuifilaceae bacterium]HPQ35863.1 Fur family transcriptional regulator [Tenuifilaceae bacterium]HRX69054.1 Fur family transcriptional regulator [Tenuifilaceae bacterium]
MEVVELTKILSEKGLKVTPQRIAVMDALVTMRNHPNTESVIDFVRKNHPYIAVGTVYKTLETFVDKGILKKVKTDNDVTRYDYEMCKHHHIYCEECDIIEDYVDEELDKLLNEYFKKKRIPKFDIKELKLHIIGNYKNHKPT